MLLGGCARFPLPVHCPHEPSVCKDGQQSPAQPSDRHNAKEAKDGP